MAKLAATLAGGCTFIIIVLAGTPALAQLDTAAIVGTVRDSSNALIPGATVTATQTATGVSVSAVTNAQGEYVFPTVKIGVYTVAAELQGFRRAVRQNVDLHVQERVEVDFTLAVGTVSEEVVVVAQRELLHTQNADMGYAVDQRQVTDLPLLGRRYAELALLTTGVVTAPAGLTSRGEDTFFNVNGNYATWNNFMLDGADNNSFSTNLQERSAQVIQPPVDALEEFRVQTRTYSAEFGKAAGAVINASIKQGTNAFRGDLFDFFRDETLNANTWDNNRAGRAKGQFNQHIGGATLGGPIVKGRTFFFGDYQATRTTKALTQTAVVPTPLMRQGNMIELSRGITASPFAPAGCINTVAKTIDPSCFDPAAAALLTLYPLPNIPSAVAQQGQPGSFGAPNYISNGLLHNDVNQFDLRGDQNLRTGRDQLFGRYSYMNTTRHEPPVLEDPVASGDFSSDIFNKGQSAVGGWSRIFGGAMFSELRVSWNRIASDSRQLAFGQKSNGQFLIKGVPDDPRYSGGVPHTQISGLTRVGGPFFRPQDQTSQVFQFSENVTWTRGTHSFKIGGERRRDIVDYVDLRALNGFLSFNDGRYTNAGYGDFLLGLVTQQGLTLYHEANLYSDGWQAYGQDTWRVGSNLTINYGLRYEYFTPMQDRNNLLTNIDPATGQVVYAKSSGSIFDRTLIHPDRNDFAPRVGVSYSMTPRVLVRGGYGIFYQQTDRYGSESQLALNPPQLVDVFQTANSAAEAPVILLRNGFTPISASTIDPTKVQWRIQDPTQKTPIVHQFSIGPEVRLTENTVASAEYVGNVTRNGRKLRNLNEGIITAGNVVVFPYAQYGFGNAFLEQIATNGEADYHALQVRVQRRFSGGLSFTSSFTYGRARGNFLDHLSAGGGASGNFPLTAYDPSRDYGPLAFDIPKRFVQSFIYEIPVGSGKHFNPGGVAGAIAGNWMVNGILSLNDGRPFTITATDRANTGTGRQARANCVGDPVPGGFNQSINQWFDPAAFTDTAAFAYGNCGFNTVRGPGSKSMNMSVFRNFALGAARRLEFRLEAFNLFNWTNYDFPASSVSNLATFGKITSTLGDPRELQLAVKFYF
jgi:Carboxypeptidase regulatory-like domain